MRSLIVAIDDYPGSQNDPNCCINDAHNFEELLVSGLELDGVSIAIHINDQATIENVEKGIEWLFSGADRDEPLVVVFSGHRTPLRADASGNIDEALVHYDGLLLDDALVSKSKSNPSQYLTLFLDCGFSAGLSKKVFGNIPSGTEGLANVGKARSCRSATPKGKHKDKSFRPSLISSYG